MPTAIRIMLLLFLLGLIAFGVRFRDLQHPSFTWDEWSTYNASVNYHHDGVWYRPIYYGFYYGQLPYFLADAMYRIVGVRDIVPRLISGLAGVLVVLGVGYLGMRLVGPGWGFYAGLTAALCPFHLAGSRLGLTQGHLIHTVFLMGLLIVGLEWRELGRRIGCLRSWVAGVCLGLALGTDLLAAYWCVTAAVVAVWAVFKNEMTWSDMLRMAGGGMFGLAVASPMYLADPVGAFHAVFSGNLTSSTSTGFLWLGDVVEQMPWYYYAVILAVKCSPVLVTLAVAGGLVILFRREHLHPFWLVLLTSLWILIPISMNGWVGPNYIAGVLPIVYLMATVPLVVLWRRAGHVVYRVACIALAGGVLFSEAMMVRAMHPDYPMTSIHYSERYFGEFQGPAVSHGQWLGEAMAFIADDAGDRQPKVLVFEEFTQSQLDYYARKYGLDRPSRMSDFESPESVWMGLDYIILNQDARRMIAPQHPEGLVINAPLVKLVDESERLENVKTFYSGPFPMVWVYRVIK